MSDFLYCAADLKVFVYGTLKPGYVNYERYCRGKVISTQPAIAKGILYDLPLGYPAMTPGEGWVQGVVLSFAEHQILAALDALEAYDGNAQPEDNEYQRSQIQVYTPNQAPLGLAWGYWMLLEHIHALGGRWIPGGRWPDFDGG